MKSFFLVFICAFILLSFTYSKQKRVVREGEYDIECYVSSKTLSSFKNKRTYFWFKSGEIHNSEAYAGGPVLDDAYLKYYRSNQLAETGAFDQGLKVGKWQSWYQDGRLKEIIRFHNGMLDGNYESFTKSGAVLLSGKYRNNKKVGKWVNHYTQDTVWYRNNVPYVKDPRSLFEQIFTRNDSLDLKRETKFKTLLKRILSKREEGQDTLSVNKAIAKDALLKSEEEKKSNTSFFKRVFKQKKKEKPLPKSEAKTTTKKKNTPTQKERGN